MLRSLSLIVHLLLALPIGACDSGSEGLVLNGTYRGTGQSQVSAGAGPISTQLDVAATFTDATAGALNTALTVEVTLGGTVETYAGTLTGTLTDGGAISFSGSLSGEGSRTLPFNASGEASASRIEVDVTGSLPVSDLVLTR